MPPDPAHSDEAHMWAMLQAIQELQAISSEYSQADIHTDILFQRAAERCIEIIGELANQVSKDGRELYTQINWIGIINQRHVIAHSYDGINYDLLWTIIIEHAPILRKQLIDILPPAPEDPLPENTP